MQIDSVLTAIGLVIAVAAIYVPVRRQIHNDKVAAQTAAKKELNEAVAQAVKDKTDPLVAQLQERTTERNYWRERADDLQDQLNQKKA